MSWSMTEVSVRQAIRNIFFSLFFLLVNRGCVLLPSKDLLRVVLCDVLNCCQATHREWSLVLCCGMSRWITSSKINQEKSYFGKMLKSHTKGKFSALQNVLNLLVVLMQIINKVYWFW